MSLTGEISPVARPLCVCLLVSNSTLQIDIYQVSGQWASAQLRCELVRALAWRGVTSGLSAEMRMMNNDLSNKHWSVECFVLSQVFARAWESVDAICGLGQSPGMFQAPGISRGDC